MKSKDDFILPDESPFVQKELERRTAARKKADESDKDRQKEKTDKSKKQDAADEPEKEHNKWQSTHQALAEKRVPADIVLLSFFLRMYFLFVICIINMNEYVCV